MLVEDHAILSQDVVVVGDETPVMSSGQAQGQWDDHKDKKCPLKLILDQGQ